MQNASSKWREVALLPASIVGLVFLSAFYIFVGWKMLGMIEFLWNSLFG